MKLRTESIDFPGEFSYTRDWRDRILWPFVKLFFRVKSCGWHWVPYQSEPRCCIKVEGDPNAADKPSEWKKVVVLEPFYNLGEGHTSRRYRDGYRVGFKNFAGTSKICSIIIPKGKLAALRIGQEDVEFFATTASSQHPLELYKYVGFPPTRRKWRVVFEEIAVTL